MLDNKRLHNAYQKQNMSIYDANGGLGKNVCI